MRKQVSSYPYAGGYEVLFLFHGIRFLLHDRPLRNVLNQEAIVCYGVISKFLLEGPEYCLCI